MKNGADLWRYVKKRTIAYIFPWIVWSFLVRGIIFGQHDFLNIKWLLWHMDSGYWFLATIWTISMIFGVGTFFAGKMTKEPGIKRHAVTLLIYIIGMVMLAGIGFVAGFSFFAIKLTLYYMPFYFAGYLYGSYSDRIMSKEIGKRTVDAIIAVCFSCWFFIILRWDLYAMSDSGFSIVLRAASSLAGCIAVCGLCKGLFCNTPVTVAGYSENWNSLNGDLSRSLLAPDTDNQLLDYDISNGCSGKGNQQQLGHENGYVWRWKLRDVLLWAGKYSLSIYMVHGLVLNVLMPEVRPIFPSISGYGLIIGNFTITILLCAVVISLITQSNILKKILGMK